MRTQDTRQFDGRQTQKLSGRQAEAVPTTCEHKAPRFQRALPPQQHTTACCEALPRARSQTRPPKPPSPRTEAKQAGPPIAIAAAEGHRRRRVDDGNARTRCRGRSSAGGCAWRRSLRTEAAPTHSAARFGCLGALRQPSEGRKQGEEAADDDAALSKRVSGHVILGLHGD